MYSEPSQWTTVPTGGDASSQVAKISVCLDEARALLVTHANLLLSGPGAITSEVLRSLRPVLRQPVWTTGAAPLSLPSTSVGTLIVRRAAGLAAEDQVRLLQWVRDQRPYVQVITITPKPLFPLITRGAFLETLYYTLNMVYVKI
jgi:hypothetical protein